METVHLCYARISGRCGFCQERGREKAKFLFTREVNHFGILKEKITSRRWQASKLSNEGHVGYVTLL